MAKGQSRGKRELLVPANTVSQDLWREEPGAYVLHVLNLGPGAAVISPENHGPSVTLAPKEERDFNFDKFVSVHGSAQGPADLRVEAFDRV